MKLLREIVKQPDKTAKMPRVSKFWKDRKKFPSAKFKVWDYGSKGKKHSPDIKGDWRDNRKDWDWEQAK